jgi:hypothetical protein
MANEPAANEPIVSAAATVIVIFRIRAFPNP